MGHRHVFSPSYMFETENDQRWNLTEHPYAHIAQSGAAESSSLTYPADNMSIDGAQYASHCNPAPVSSTYSSLAHDAQNPHYRQDAAGPSDLPTDPSSAGGFYMVPENYRNSASSSNYNEHPVHEDDSFDIRVSNGRWQSKRKSPGVPVGYERDGTNRYNNDAGSSSDISMPADPWEETPNMDFLHTPWDYPAVNPSHGGTSLTIGGESSLRNVRSRAALDLEGNLVGTPSPNNLSHDYYTTSRPMDVSSFGHLMGQRSQGSMREWNPTQISNTVHDSSSLDQELNPFLMGSSNPNAPVEIGGYNGLIAGSNHDPQNFQGTSAQSVRGIRSNHIQRSGPTFRASSSSMRLGHAVASDEGLQLATGSYSYRHPRPLSTIAWRSGDRNGRARMSIDRYRSFSEEANFRDRAVPGGLMIVDRSAFYGSRNPFDHHRDMRLDIDDMSYEELLALGERIGSVSTGLSEDLISRCLTESIYCSSDQIQEEGACVICLEEYANMDDVGILKGCRHDFHVGCIKKWLSMKNLCPICKAEPMKQK